MLQEHRNCYMYVLSAIAATEGKDAKKDQCVPDLQAEPNDDFEVLDLEEDDEDEEWFKGEKPMQGCYATHLLNALKAATESLCQVQIDLTASQYKFFLLLEHVNGIASDDEDLLKDPAYLAIYKQFLDADALGGFALNTPQLNKKLGQQRWNVYKNFIAETVVEGTKSKNAHPYFLKLLGPICNSFFFETHDPAFGLWESLAHGNKDFDLDKLLALANAPPFPHTVFGKRSFRCCNEGNLEWVHGQVKAANDSRPIFEKETEAQWKERCTYKNKMNAAASNWSKLVMRMLAVQDHARYNALPVSVDEQKLTTLPVERVLQAMTPIFDGMDETDEEIKTTLDAFLKEEIAAAGGKGRYQTKRLVELKELLEKHRKAFNSSKPEKRREYPQRYRDVVHAAGDTKFTSYRGADVGFRGVKAEVTTQQKLDETNRFFKEQASSWVCDRLELSTRLKKESFFPLLHVATERCCAVFKFKDGYFYGIDLILVGEWKQCVWRFPVTPQEVVFRCDLLCEWDAYTHIIEGGRMGKDNYHVIMEEVWDDIVEGKEVKNCYFRWMKTEQQLHLMQPFLDAHPILTTDHLECANSDKRQKIFKMFNDGNTLSPDEQLELAAKLTRTSKEIIPSYIEAKKKRIEEQLAKAAAKATETGRKKPEQPEDKKAASGITRLAAMHVFYFYDAVTREVLAKAKSHRQKQGLLPDRIRIHYEKNKRVVLDSTVHPSCTAEGNPLDNVTACLLPSVCFATNKEIDDIAIEEGVEMVDEMELWYEDEDDEDADDGDDGADDDEKPEKPMKKMQMKKMNNAAAASKPPAMKKQRK
eukprot:g13733.t1